MLINYDVKKINTALEDFYNTTGIEIGLLKPDFSEVYERKLKNIPYCQSIQQSESGRNACLVSDYELLKKCRESRHMQMSICHAGLLNIAVPLFYNDIIIGYIILGCIKTSDAPVQDFEYAEKSKKYYSSLQTFDSAKIQSVSNIAIMLAKYILLENMLTPNFDVGLQKAVEYINTHLDGELTISEISKNTHLSKSVLYKNFHSIFDCTVSEYIKARRIEYSIELMKSGNLTVEELAQRAGFSSTAYFSKIFKEHIGISPIKYKKQLWK